MNKANGWTPCESNGLRISSGVDSFKRRCLAALCSCVLLLAPMVRADDAPPKDGPRLSLSTTEIGLGEVKAVDGHERTVEVQNKGTDTLKIGPIVPLCTCVQASVDTLEVKAGETKSFSIRAMLATYPSTEIKGSVRLHTNDPNQPDVDINVGGRIAPDFVVVPDEVNFGTLKAGETPTCAITVRQTGEKPLLVDRVVAPKGMSARIVENSPPEGAGVRENPAREYCVYLSLLTDLPPGPYSGSLTIFTNIARVPRYEINVSAEIADLDISVAPKVLAFGAASPGEKLGDFIVEGTELSKIEAVSDDPCLLLKVVEELPATKYRVEVCASDKATVGSLASQITLRASSADLTKDSTLRVFGKIK